MTTLWNTISTSNYDGTSTTLEILIGILREYNILNNTINL